MANEIVKDKGAANAPASDIQRLVEVLAEMTGNVGLKGGTPFIPLTPEQLAKLPKKTEEQVADEYYASVKLDDFPWPGIHVSSDGQIFMGHVQGENARDNHVRANTGMTYKSFPKPKK